MARIKMRFGGVEVAFAFLTAGARGLAARRGGRRAAQKALEILGEIKPDQKMSMGTWVELGASSLC